VLDHKIKGRVLVVAGSDPSGGAGIEGDIKTITSLGCYALSAITSITDQDTKKINGVYNLRPKMISSQIQTSLNDIGADCIKLGMLPSQEVIMVVSKILNIHARNIPRVVDTVIESSGGYEFMNNFALDTFLSKIVNGATIITPNLPEAEKLINRKIRNLEEMYESVEDLRALGSDAVLLKGGHLDSDNLVDLLIKKDSVESFKSLRIESTSTHGTGCALSSAIAAGLAQSLSLTDSVARAHYYVNRAIELAPGFGKGFGPLNHCHTVDSSSFTVS